MRARVLPQPSQGAAVWANATKDEPRPIASAAGRDELEQAKQAAEPADSIRSFRLNTSKC